MTAKTMEALFIDLNKNLSLYKVVPTDKAIGEDGTYVEGEDGALVGYALVNTITGVVEHTSTVLPGVLYQAEHCEKMLEAMLQEQEEGEPSLAAVEDIVPPTLQ